MSFFIFLPRLWSERRKRILVKYSNVIEFLAGIHRFLRELVKRDVDFDADLVGSKCRRMPRVSVIIANWARSIEGV